MAITVFLGGTVGNSTWRKSFTAALVEAGVDPNTIFDPVVPDWTPECQAAEDAAKATARFNLFYLCDPNQEGNPVSVYSLVEAVMGMYDQPSNTVVVFDNAGYGSHALKSLTKSEKDLKKRFPNGLVFGTCDQALDFLIGRLAVA
jgi:hypothetical protein